MPVRVAPGGRVLAQAAPRAAQPAEPSSSRALQTRRNQTQRCVVFPITRDTCFWTGTAATRIAVTHVSAVQVLTEGFPAAGRRRGPRGPRDRPCSPQLPPARGGAGQGPAEADCRGGCTCPQEQPAGGWRWLPGTRPPSSSRNPGTVTARGPAVHAGPALFRSPIPRVVGRQRETLEKQTCAPTYCGAYRPVAGRTRFVDAPNSFRLEKLRFLEAPGVGGRDPLHDLIVLSITFAMFWGSPAFPDGSDPSFPSLVLSQDDPTQAVGAPPAAAAWSADSFPVH